MGARCGYCSINLKRQSEHSGLRPDTSSLVLFFFLFNFDQIKPIGKQNKAILLMIPKSHHLVQNFGVDLFAHCDATVTINCSAI